MGKNKYQATDWGKKGHPEGMMLYGTCYLSVDTIRAKIKDVTKRILKDYEKGCKKNFQHQLDAGVNIDIRLSKQIMKQNMTDMQTAFDAIDRFLAQTDDNTRTDFFKQWED